MTSLKLTPIQTTANFRTRVDAELVRKLYKMAPVLVNNIEQKDPWGFRGLLMFYMNTDSNLFLSAPTDSSYPLYEAKMFWHFDHRWATLQDGGKDPTDADKENPRMVVNPRYWINKEHVERRLDNWKRKWIMCYRAITNATNEDRLLSGLTKKWVGNNDLFCFLELPIINCYHPYCEFQFNCF